LIVETLQEILEHSEILVIGDRSEGFEDAVERFHTKHIVIDFVRIARDLSWIPPENYEGLCW